jgi:hypothetical protein
MSLEESLLHLRLGLRGGGTFAAALSVVCHRIQDAGLSNCECLKMGEKKYWWQSGVDVSQSGLLGSLNSYLSR